MEASSALYSPLHTLIENAMIRTDDRATALSLNALLGSGIGVCVNTGLGTAADASLSGALLLCGLLCLMAAVLFRQAAKAA